MTWAERWATTRAPKEDGESRDPWSRWGWLMGVIWLVFLAFPLSAAWNLESDTMRLVTIAAILTFAFIYAAGIRTAFIATTELSFRARLLMLPALAGLCCVAYAGIGLEALGMAPFLIAWSMFAFSLAVSLGVVATVLGLTLLIPALADQSGVTLQFFGISAMVTIATMIPRVLGERDAEYQDVAQQLLLVAERERMARDVHDLLGHSLTVVSVKAELAERLIASDPQRASTEVREIQALTRQALAEVRATVAGLRVVRVSEELASAQTALGDAGIELTVRGDESEVDPRHRIVTAWVVREAVTNIVRHSGATAVEIELTTAGVRISDNGRGLSGAATSGNGLRGLRERVDVAGGTFSTRPADETGGEGRPGTIVEVTW